MQHFSFKRSPTLNILTEKSAPSSRKLLQGAKLNSFACNQLASEHFHMHAFCTEHKCWPGAYECMNDVEQIIYSVEAVWQFLFLHGWYSWQGGWVLACTVAAAAVLCEFVCWWVCVSVTCRQWANGSQLEKWVPISVGMWGRIPAAVQRQL